MDHFFEMFKPVRPERNKQENIFRQIGQQRDYYDYNLLAVVILLTCFGLVMLYSTSSYEASVNFNNDMFFFGKQAVISAVSVVAMIIASQVDYHLYISWSGILYLISVALMVVTGFIGNEVNGAKRWLSIGPVSFQPAEMAKLAVILFVSWVISRGEGPMKGWKEPMEVGAIGLIAAGVAFIFTKNLSTAIIIAGICFFLLFLVHKDYRPFLTIIGAGIVLVIFFILLIIPQVTTDTKSFRLRRIMVWRDPESYLDEGGYQVMQGLYAIGSGGFFGKGLGNSAQKLGAVPEAQNDMIFSIICEELGVFGAILVVLLFAFLLYRLLFIARNSPDLLGALIASGVFIHISLQVLLNIAVVTNLIPTTGITLPFVSYGGSSIIFLMAEMTVVLSVSKQISLK